MSKNRIGQRTLRHAGLLLGLVSLAALSGCGSLDIGESEFACSGMPNVTTCTSVRDVYEMTDDGVIPAPVGSASQGKTENADNVTSTKKADPTFTNPSERSRQQYVTPAIPNRPVPIRTPAQVMRIFIAPWEDKQGSLIVPGYVYTEIQPRRWIIGHESLESNPVLTPLQVTRSASEMAGDHKANGGAGNLNSNERAWLDR